MPVNAADERTRPGLEAWDGAPVHPAIVQADHAQDARLGPGDVTGAGVTVERPGRPAL